jgi:hypothetical protein
VCVTTGAPPVDLDLIDFADFRAALVDLCHRDAGNAHFFADVVAALAPPMVSARPLLASLRRLEILARWADVRPLPAPSRAFVDWTDRLARLSFESDGGDADTVTRLWTFVVEAMELPPYLGDWTPDAVWRRHCGRLFGALVEQSVRPLAVVVAAAAAAWQVPEEEETEGEVAVRLGAGLRTLQAAAVRRRLTAAAAEDHWTADDLRRFGGKPLCAVAWPALRRRLGVPPARRRRRRFDGAPDVDAGDALLVRLWAFQRQFVATQPTPGTQGAAVVAWHDARWDVPEDAVRFVADADARRFSDKKSNTVE